MRAVRARHTPYVLYSAQNLDKRYPLPFRVLQRWALRARRGGERVQRRGRRRWWCGAASRGARK
ncbi:MAG: hypothetical protein V9F04_18100 [Dermatophilaceae bacterium]